MNDDYRDERIWELYHANSKNSFGSGQVSSRASRKTGALNAGFNFEENSRIALPSPDQTLQCDLLEVIRSRRSQTPVAQASLSIEALSVLLFAAGGIVSHESSGRKAAPSAGALYPIDIFVKLKHCESVGDGIYYYSPQGHTLVGLSTSSSVQTTELFLQEDVVDDANVELFLCGTFGRLSEKYGERGYRYCLLEAGHIAQNVVLVSTSMGLKSCCFGGFIDTQVEGLFGLDGVRQSVIYSCMIGH